MPPNNYRLECPSCGASSGYGPDEDGYPDCHICGGPRRCPACTDYITTYPLEGAPGYACEVCGESYHESCFPQGRSDTIICTKCTEADRDPAAN